MFVFFVLLLLAAVEFDLTAVLTAQLLLSYPLPAAVD